MEDNQGKEVLARFGHEDFREGQREPIEAVLRGEDAVVVMPTGAGKSLCYQVTALMLPGTTLVVSPLIALMKDQVDALERKGIAVTLINSTVGRGETERRLKGMADGAYKLVYVAPERFRNSAFRSALAKTRLSMVAIDEAHGIIYVATRKHAQTVYEEVQRVVPASSGVEVLMYHAALTELQRTKVQRAFMTAEHPVVIATTAFGMGIDRADIRFVVHWDIPGGIEQYYQEIGRAGRDGARAECELLFSYADVKVQEFFVDGANPDAETGLKVWKMFAGYGNRIVEFDSATFARALGVKNGIAVATAANVLLNAGFLIRPEENRPYAYQVVEGVTDKQVQSVFNARREKFYRDRRRLRKMIDFAYFEGCRHKFILDYFGDQSPTRTCGGCDNCDKRQAVGCRAAVEDGAPVSEPKQELVRGTLMPSAVDMEDLLRRYMKIQDESRRHPSRTNILRACRRRGHAARRLLLRRPAPRRPAGGMRDGSHTTMN